MRNNEEQMSCSGRSKRTRFNAKRWMRAAGSVRSKYYVIITHFYVIITSLLRIITSLLRHYYIFLDHYYVIITYYYTIITPLLHIRKSL